MKRIHYQDLYYYVRAVCLASLSRGLGKARERYFQNYEMKAQKKNSNSTSTRQDYIEMKSYKILSSGSNDFVYCPTERNICKTN